MSVRNTKDYEGDLTVEEAYALLAREADATLVDVRTHPEWQFVGVPNLDVLGKTPILREWQVYPSMQVAPDFAAGLGEELSRRGAEKTSALVFLCRSGARSRSAAVAMTARGWARCYNVSDGFEGALDAERHRGSLGGWRASGLPWTQS
jgi:rhodanese-related sulfurtransferase